MTPDERIAELEAEIERYRAGADEAQPEPGVSPTPEQWWAHLLSLSEESRMSQLYDAARRDEIAGQCWTQSHDAEIAYLRESGARLVAERDALQARLDDPEELVRVLVDAGVLHERREDYLLPDGSLDKRYLSKRRFFTDWKDVVPR